MWYALVLVASTLVGLHGLEGGLVMGPTDPKGFPHISRILRMRLRPSIYPTVLGRGLESYGYVDCTYVPLVIKNPCYVSLCPICETL